MLLRMRAFELLGQRGLLVTVHSAGRAEEGHLTCCSTVRISFSMCFFGFRRAWSLNFSLCVFAFSLSLMCRSLRFAVSIDEERTDQPIATYRSGLAQGLVDWVGEKGAARCHLHEGGGDPLTEDGWSRDRLGDADRRDRLRGAGWSGRPRSGLSDRRSRYPYGSNRRGHGNGRPRVESDTINIDCLVGGGNEKGAHERRCRHS